MRLKTRKANVPAAAVLVLLVAAAGKMQAEDSKTPYPNMAAPEQYIMEKDAEIALAQSAAPRSISDDADVMVMGRHGYEKAVKGKNGFVCLVERSWNSGIDDPDFWNPKLRAPICFNPPAARSVVPLTLKKTELVLAGRSRTQMFEALKAAQANKELPAVESGAMCYMMSKQGYLNSRDGHWHPHLMFFVPFTETAVWGANLPQSPVYGLPSPEDGLTTFLVPIAKWSDGTLAGEDH